MDILWQEIRLLMRLNSLGSPSNRTKSGCILVIQPEKIQHLSINQPVRHANNLLGCQGLISLQFFGRTVDSDYRDVCLKTKRNPYIDSRNECFQRKEVFFFLQNNAIRACRNALQTHSAPHETIDSGNVLVWF